MSTVLARTGDVLAVVWHRASATAAPPSAVMLLGALLLAAAAVGEPRVWRLARYAVTAVHEGAHALVGLACGRHLAGIRLRVDTSGTTATGGPRRGVGRIATAAAGYLGASAAGLAAAYVTAAGHAAALLWVLLVALVGMLLFTRNAFGVLTVVLLLGLVGAAAWALPPGGQEVAGAALAGFLLLGGPRTVLELWALRSRGARETDADSLATLTGLPAAVWVGAFLLADVAAAALGAVWLLR